VEGKLRVPKVDWNLLKTEYVTTTISYRGLSEKYGVSVNSIYHKSKDEGWGELRREYIDKTFTKTMDKSAEKNAARLNRLIEATTKAVDIAADALKDERQFYRYVTDTGELELSKLDTKSLREFTAALKDLNTLMRDFYNIPTPGEAEARRIAAERLALEKRRVDAGEVDEAETGVIMLPPVKTEEGGEDDEC
jgi:hypothetical protein